MFSIERKTKQTPILPKQILADSVAVNIDRMSDPGLAGVVLVQTSFFSVSLLHKTFVEIFLFGLRQCFWNFWLVVITPWKEIDVLKGDHMLYIEYYPYRSLLQVHGWH